MRTRTRTALMVAVASLAAAAFIASACDDSATDTADGTSTASQASIDDLTARVRQNEMLFALVATEDLKLHEIDDSIQEGAPIERAIPDVRKFVRIMALTNWTPDLEEEAGEVHDLGLAWLNALDEGDIEAAKAPSAEAHEAFHDFAETAWNVVVKDLPPDEAGPTEHDEEASPTAGETPAAEATP